MLGREFEPQNDKPNLPFPGKTAYSYKVINWTLVVNNTTHAAK